MTDMVAQDYHLEFISPEKSHGLPQKKNLMALPANEPEEPRKKRVRPLSRVASLVSLISPVKSTSIKRLGQTLQRSISLRPESGPLVPPSPPSSPPSRSPTLFDGAWRAVRLGGGCGGGVAATPGPHPPSSHSSSSLKRRDSKLWSEMYDTGTTERLSRAEIKRQEAIFELAQGEQDLIEDLTLAKKVYHDPMLTLAIMSAKELEKIFGMLETFIPLHADLLAKLKTARKDDGTTDRVGHILAAWLPCLTAYSRYCSNQVAARLLLERKRGEARVHDFLQRCLESPFSRRLDLWSFLDAPRSRLVKYPLLLRGILRHTPNDHADRQLLEEAISTAAGIVRDVNSRTGESECRYFWNRLDWSDVPAGDGATAVAAPRLLSCHGELRTARGARVYVFLFERALVVTRLLGGGGGGGGGGGASDGGGPRYRTRGRPIPVSELALWDLTDGDVITVGGSFRGAFRGGQRAMNMFRVGHTDPSRGQSITLKANDAFGKQRWLGCIRAAVQTAARAHASPRSNGAGSGWCAETEARCPPTPSFGDLGVRPESSEAPNSAARGEGDAASSHPATLSTVAAATSEPAAGDAADFPTASCSSAEDDVSAGDAMERDGIDAPPVGSSDATPTSDATTSSRRSDAAHRSAQQCLEPQGTSEAALRAAEPPRTKDVSPETLEGSELFGDTPQKDIVAVLETALPADVQASEQVPTAAATNTQALETTTSEAVGDLHAGIRPTLLSLNSGGSSAMGSYEATLTAVPGPLRSGERNMNSIANIFCEKDPEQKHLRSMLEEQTTKL